MKTAARTLAAGLIALVAAYGLLNWAAGQGQPAPASRCSGHDVQLHAQWGAETRTTPKLTWSRNGASTPVIGLHSDQSRPGGLYEGEWGTVVRAKCGDVLAVEVWGTADMPHVLCAVGDVVTTGGPDRHCRAELTVTATS